MKAKKAEKGTQGAEDAPMANLDSIAVSLFVNLLAPSGALVFIMVYYIHTICAGGHFSKCFGAILHIYIYYFRFSL